ncbi:MAG: hypothetical protein IPL49_17955 [Saprospirales bacterium]|nr:hypothetical protein [Saprospirales bacterium]
MIKHLLPLFLLLTAATLNAQVGINQDNSAADPSAMLDVKSSDKGMLIPRMTTAQRNAIASPATGLLVYDETTGGFGFTTARWQDLSADADADPTNELELPAGGGNGQILTADGNDGVSWSDVPISNIISDADNDTKIQVEKNPDEDIIRFQAAGKEVAHISVSTLNSGTIETGTSGLFYSNTTTPGWQSFTATADAQIISIEILYNSFGGYPNKSFSIYEGEGTGGNLLASLGSRTLNYGWNLIMLPTPVNISSGAQYTIRFQLLCRYWY